MNRRKFLKASCFLGAGVSLAGLGFAVDAPKAYAADMSRMNALKKARQSTTICCYCAVGCSLICSTDTVTGNIINIEGDPEHPVNEGALCAKGAALFQVSAANQHRLTKVQYRRPGGTAWEQVDWDFAVNRIAQLIKEDRDKGYTVTNEQGQLVNRAENIGLMGSSNVLSEECWATSQFARGLGLTYIDHQARV